jgi:hypothetical protein
MSAKKLLSVCACLCVYALLFTGCSKSGSTASAPPDESASSAPASPCSLIAQPEAETALGTGAVVTPTNNPRTGMSECRLKPGTTKGVVEIIMTVHPATGWDDVKKMMTTDSNTNAKSVAGLGDDAFVGRFLGYNVRKGNRYVQVFGDMRNDNAANDKATHYLAERAVSRL